MRPAKRAAPDFARLPINQLPTHEHCAMGAYPAPYDMGNKYLPSVRDQKAVERFHQLQKRKLPPPPRKGDERPKPNRGASAPQTDL